MNETTVVSIPLFPESVPLTVEMKALYEEVSRRTPPAASDMVFTTLVGWQEFFDYRVSRWGDLLLIHYLTGEKTMLLPPLPLGASPLADHEMAERMAGLAPLLGEQCGRTRRMAVFTAVSERCLPWFPAGRYEIAETRDLFDYVYLRTDLAELKGSAYAPKRNLVRQFERAYRYRYEPLSSSNADELHRFMLSVRESKMAANDAGASCAFCMACRLMRYYGALNLTGGLLYADEVLAAATVATIVPDFAYPDGIFPTAVVHVENALSGYKGSYQAINRYFCRSLPPGVVYVNREEDLGIPGLRTAKLSYQPARFVRKYTAAVR